MKVAGVMGVMNPCPRAATLPVSTRINCSVLSTSSGHVSFIRDVAATHPPEHLDNLLNMLKTRGETILSPGIKRGLMPLSIPLSENVAGAVTALLRWPTAPPGMDMPVVEVRKHGLWLLAKNVLPFQLKHMAISLGHILLDQFIHRILVEEEANISDEVKGELYDASLEAGKKLYKRGDYVNSEAADIDVYLLKKVGMFPDVLERKALQHFEKGDHVSALITGEFYTKRDHFPGFGRPFIFNAEILCRAGQISEAKDAARVGLKSPWWTLGCAYQEAASIAQWEDEQIEYIRERVTEEGRQEDLKKGKAPAQVALDEAAFLLDLASIEGTWTDYLERIAECYREAGLSDIAKFVLYQD